MDIITMKIAESVRMGGAIHDPHAQNQRGVILWRTICGIATATFTMNARPSSFPTVGSDTVRRK